MGRDKTLLPAPPYPTLLERQLALLTSLAPCELLVSARVDQALPRFRWGPPPRVVRDDGSAGPIGGLIAVLRAASAPHVLVLGVDVAGMESGMLRRIVGAVPEMPPEGGVIPHTAIAPQPLASLWPRAILPLAEAQLEAGADLSLRTLVERGVTAGYLRWLNVPSWDEACFANWNRPGDVRAFRPVFRARQTRPCESAKPGAAPPVSLSLVKGQFLRAAAGR